MNVTASLAPLLHLIAEGRLYPSLVLHGATADERRRAALILARSVLCTAELASRPCGECANCRRVGYDDDHFHPDFHYLERDRPTATSAAAVRGWVAEAQLAPFEAGAKVFVALEAETLSEDAADVLLKVLEEPPGEAARHFVLLAPSDRELPPTIRSRSMSFYLGAAAAVEGGEETVTRLQQVVESGEADLAARLAEAILGLDDWQDPRAAAGWERAASALIEVGGRYSKPWLLDLASDLLQAPRWRIRGVPAHRIVEGSVAGRAPWSAR